MAAGRSKTGNHVRSNSSLVPAVPRIFEKKTQQSSESATFIPIIGRSLAAGKEVAYSTAKDENKHSDEKASLEPADQNEQGSQMHANRDEHVSTPRQSSANPVSNGENFKPRGAGSEKDGHLKLVDQIGSKPRVSLPSYAHYPVEPRSSLRRASRSGVASFPLPSSSQPTPQNSHKRHSRNRSIHKIAFGSFTADSESSESSPTLPPSATSTQFTQPTPVSETRSQASLSEQEEISANAASKAVPTTVVNDRFNSSQTDPCRPGPVVNHAVDFFKYRQQFLMQHLQNMYMSNNGDVALTVYFGKTASRFNLHTAIICQSPMLAAAVQLAVNQKQFGPDGKICISIGVQDNFTTVNAVESVLKSMYGFASLDVKALDRPLLDPREFHTLFAASCLLGLPDHQTFSANCIVQLLDWRTLAGAFDLSLAGRKWGPCIDPYPKRSEEIASPLFQPQASFIFNNALSALVQELDRTDFVFQPAAPNFPFLGGLSTGPSSTEMPPLAAQEIVSEDPNAGISARNLNLSGLLLSLPLPVLQRLAAELSARPNPKVAGLIELTIQERERRRIAHLRAPVADKNEYFRELCVTDDFLPGGTGVVNDMS